jgi:hypothetical protein
LHAERSAIGNEAGMNFPGISLSARRNINLAIISYAELLCEQVDALGLAARAKEAVARRVHEMNFGTRRRMRGLHAAGAKAQAAVVNQKQITGRVKPRWSACAPPANTATRPIPCRRRIRWPRGRKVDKAEARAAAAPAWNVLAEDYWDLTPADALPASGYPITARAVGAAPASGVSMRRPSMGGVRRQPPQDPPQSATPHPARCRRRHRP